MHIIGTAGHVDHGKSSLVIALTGHNPDRFIEERERGMTLDLGFAPLRFADGVEAGIIDVPGHERFLHNMLAGAAGMELLLLVIAAPEGPKPQTYEHLHILDLLNVQRAIIVLSKIDLVDPQDREIAAALALDACAGTVAQGAPVIAVSTVTGEGIGELKTAIHDALVALPPRRPQAPAYMPVDRVFALAGHGTIVTGTLMQGVIGVGDTLALQPSGIPARIKSLQIFGKRVESASGGSRVAVNLPGIEVTQIGRGETLVAPSEFEPARELSVEFTPIASALGILRRRLPVRVHVGSAEILGHIRFADGPPQAVATVAATLTLTRPAVFYPGIRMIVRRMSPKDLLGGAVVSADVSPASDVRLSSRTLQDGAFEEGPARVRELAEAIRASGLAPLSAAKAAARANVALPVANSALSWLVEHGYVSRIFKPEEFISHDVFEDAFASVAELMKELHERSPWRVGIATAEAAQALKVAEPLALRLLNAWHEDGRISTRAQKWHLAGHSPELTREQKAFFEQALTVSPQAPYLPTSFAAVSRAAGQRSKEMLEGLDSLLAVGACVRIGDDVYRRSQIEQAQSAISAFISSHGHATMAQLRDVLGTSRKFALPLMEYFDSSGFTVRDGDLRRLRTKSKSNEQA